MTDTIREDGKCDDKIWKNKQWKDSESKQWKDYITMKETEKEYEFGGPSNIFMTMIILPTVLFMLNYSVADEVSGWKIV